MKQPRSILGWLLALVVGVVLAAGGCANGGGDTGSGDDEGGAETDATIDGADADAGCAAGKTLCGSTCTNVTNDPKNCGHCGNPCGADQVCTGGACAYSCMTGETLCGGPVEAAAPESGTGSGKDAASEASSPVEAGTSEAGAKDAGTDAASKSEAGVGPSDAGDGGPTTPYCANTGNDPDNCGACGNVCGVNHVCNPGPGNVGECGLSCPTGEQACIAGNTCIPDSTCCSSAQCEVTGQICPMPGSTCQCPSGETVCSKTNSCISSNDCCTTADCASMAGATCPTPGQSCQCANGDKACLTQMKCISQAWCCNTVDCGPEANVGTYTCSTTTGACGIGTCNSGCYDLDMMYADGCECCDDPLGKTCQAPTGEGQLSLGQSVNVQGQLPAANESDWMQVSFSNEGTKTFHAKITFTANPNNEFVFDLSSDCNGTLIACGTEGGTCQAKTEWEEFYGSQATGNPGDPNWAPIPALPALYIRVYRASGSPAVTCDQWALTISE